MHTLFLTLDIKKERKKKITIEYKNLLDILFLCVCSRARAKEQDNNGAVCLSLS